MSAAARPGRAPRTAHPAHAVRATLPGCQRVGPGARVRGRVVVENLGRIAVGAGLTIDATPVATHLVTAPAGVLDIGDRVTIGHGVGITAHARVRLGDDVAVGPYAMILDTDFHVVGDRGARPECTPIHLGDRVVVGAHVTILRGAVVGDGARIEPGSVVSGHVPAGAHVAGVPARPVDAAPAGARAAAAGELSAGEVSVDDVAAVVAHTLGVAGALTGDRRCADVPGWDSLGMLNVMLSLEAAFGIELRPDDVVRVRLVGDLAAVVAERLADAEAGAEGGR